MKKKINGRIKNTKIQYASLKSLLEIQANNYLGKPRKLKGSKANNQKYYQIDYDPEEVDAAIIDKMERLEESNQLKRIAEELTFERIEEAKKRFLSDAFYLMDQSQLSKELYQEIKNHIL